MPPKKRSISKNQLTLNQVYEKQQTIKLGKDNSDKIDSLIEKLIKVRNDLEAKRMEEERLLKEIIKLKIAECPHNQPKVEMVDEQQQYWVMTTEETLADKNVSLFDLILTQYGQTIITKIEATRHSQVGQCQTGVKQQVLCENNTILKSQYFQDYTREFVHSLREFQYVADYAYKN